MSPLHFVVQNGDIEFVQYSISLSGIKHIIHVFKFFFQFFTQFWMHSSSYCSRKGL